MELMYVPIHPLRVICSSFLHVGIHNVLSFNFHVSEDHLSQTIQGCHWNQPLMWSSWYLMPDLPGTCGLWVVASIKAYTSRGGSKLACVGMFVKTYDVDIPHIYCHIEIKWLLRVSFELFRLVFCHMFPCFTSFFPLTGRTSSGIAKRTTAQLDLPMLGWTSCFAASSYKILVLYTFTHFLTASNFWRFR